MMIYNDFPTLSEKQYQDIKLGYEKFANKDRQLPQNLLNAIYRCKNSLFSFTKVNPNLRTVLHNNADSLKNILESLSLFYPKIQVNDNTVLTNLFNILEELTSSIKLIEELKAVESKNLYNKLLHKIKMQILEIISSTLNSLSKQSLRFFEHI